MKELEFNITIALVLLFLLVTFLQSAIDKLVDWRANQDFVVQHLSKSILKPMAKLLFVSVVLMEGLTALFCVVGMYFALTNQPNLVVYYAFAMSALTIIFLLIGQRLAKDYAGAFTLTGYFLIAVIGMIISLANY